MAREVINPLPCPCCASTTIHVSVGDRQTRTPDQVACLACGLETGGESYEPGSALSIWNRRAPPKASTSSIALLKEAVKIIHAHSRNLNKDWLQRARAYLASSH